MEPNAVAKFPEAVESDPNAVALFPEAFARYPNAVASSPEASAKCPNAVADSPEAFVRETSLTGASATFSPNQPKSTQINPVRALVSAESTPAIYLSSNPTSPQGDLW